MNSSLTVRGLIDICSEYLGMARTPRQWKSILRVCGRRLEEARCGYGTKSDLEHSMSIDLELCNLSQYLINTLPDAIELTLPQTLRISPQSALQKYIEEHVSVPVLLFPLNGVPPQWLRENLRQMLEQRPQYVLGHPLSKTHSKSICLL